MPDAAQPNPNDPDQVIAAAWQDQALWSEVANRIGQSIEFWRLAAAAAGTAGLVLSVLVGSVDPSWFGHQHGQTVLASLSVLLLATVPFLRQRLLSQERLLSWTRARNVSEQLKEAIYRHLMGALPPVPLADGSPPPDATGPGNLVRRCRAIKQSAADLALQAATTTVIPRERKTRMALGGYLADRLEGQISYYRKAGARHGAQALWLQRTEFVLGLLTVVVGALAGNLLPAEVKPDVLDKAMQAAPLAPLLVLLATLTTAVTSHLGASRALELAAKYFVTHELLRSLRDEWKVAPDRDNPARVVRLVDEVERAIATEHGGWVSDWQQAVQQTRTQLPAGGAEPAPAAVAVPAAAGFATGTAADGTLPGGPDVAPRLAEDAADVPVEPVTATAPVQPTPGTPPDPDATPTLSPDARRPFD